MRVNEVTKYGGPEVLKPADWPDPTPMDGRVRIRVLATTVGPSDLVTRQGRWAAATPNVTPPVVLGWDYVGDLLDPAPGMEVGQRVVGIYPWLDLADGTGTYAEMVLAHPDWFTALPDGADPLAAATVGINGQAALQALRSTGVRAGQSLLVTGAGGTVGAFVVQLAGAAGVHVIAVASRGDEDYVSSLGAKEIIERVPGEDLVATVRQSYPDGVDAVLDASARVPALIAAIRDGGAFASVSDPATPTAERGIHVETIHSQPEPDSLADLLGQLASGQLRTRVAGTLPLADAAEAHRRLEAGPVRGKLLLTP